MSLYDIVLFLMWTLAWWGMGYYAGYNKKCREISAEKVIDSLEDVV